MTETKVRVGLSTLELVKGDITKQNTEAIVNAANKKLAPGGGVAGAIHRAAGPELWEECKRLGGCQTGEAKITKGYQLPAPYIIHTVGPIYRGEETESKVLTDCYRNSLKIAYLRGTRTISFPAISTGTFGYPLEEAAYISSKTIIDFLEQVKETMHVRLVLYSLEALKIHEKKLSEIVNENPDLELH